MKLTYNQLENKKINNPGKTNLKISYKILDKWNKMSLKITNT